MDSKTHTKNITLLSGPDRKVYTLDKGLRPGGKFCPYMKEQLTNGWKVIY